MRKRGPDWKDNLRAWVVFSTLYFALAVPLVRVLERLPPGPTRPWFLQLQLGVMLAIWQPGFMLWVTIRSRRRAAAQAPKVRRGAEPEFEIHECTSGSVLLRVPSGTPVGCDLAGARYAAATRWHRFASARKRACIAAEVVPAPALAGHGNELSAD
jgi:hypothetical protein